MTNSKYSGQNLREPDWVERMTGELKRAYEID